jgi:hypothetical protein
MAKQSICPAAGNRSRFDTIHEKPIQLLDEPAVHELRRHADEIGVRGARLVQELARLIRPDDEALLLFGIDVVLEELRVHRRRDGEVHLPVVVADHLRGREGVRAARFVGRVRERRVDDDVVILPADRVAERRGDLRAWD